MGSSHLKVFCKKCVLRNFAKFTGKDLCQSLFLNNVAKKSKSITESLDFLGSIGENTRRKFSRKRTKKIPLGYDENITTHLKLNIEPFFIKEFKVLNT